MTTTNNEHTLISLDKLSKSKCNPRKQINDHSIKELAQSIKTDGLLHNLVVKPKGGKKKGLYEIISGERRFRALTLLAGNGEIENDYHVPVDIRHGIDKEQEQRIATVENLQREDMHPMDEAHAVTTLVQDGQSLEDISAQTGLSVSLLKQRIMLTDLCEEAQNALREETLNLAVAKALTLGTHDQQKELIKRGLDHYDADDIRSILTDEKIALSKAIFPAEQYTGNITFDLFADENESFFDSREEFFALQNKAVDELKAKKEKEGFSPVEIRRDHHFGRYQYREAEGDEKGGCIIHYTPCGDVGVHEGLISRNINKDTVEEISRKKEKPKYSNPLCEYFAMHKSLAVQSELLVNPRIAKEVTIVQMICGGGSLSTVSMKAHKCLGYFLKLKKQPESFDNYTKALFSELDKLGFQHNDTIDLLCGDNDEKARLYQSLKSMTDEQLDKFQLLLTILCFGQSGISLDTNEESLFNLVATDLNIDMSEHWTTDIDFLSRRNFQQLQSIIKDTETSHLFGSASGYKKKEIVTILSNHFQKLASQEVTDEKDMKATNWLPEVFLFPAIDPDSPQEQEDEQELVA